ncbi:MAG: recombinase family protein [Patescibacteria group bacterium]|nr:recombinase family protein [Patescibacteria group bacterium]
MVLSKFEIIGDADTQEGLPGVPCVAYCRVSKEDERVQTLSPAAQAALCKQYASIHALPDPLIVQERKSAKNITGRPELMRVLAMCRAGQVRDIVVVDLTRLFREVRGGLEAFDELQRLGVTVHSAAKGHAIDTTTADGRFMHILDMAFGERERLIISERTKRALRAKPPIPYNPNDNAGMRSLALAGRHYAGGEAPFGYQWRGPKGKNKLVVLQAEIDALHLIHAMTLAGAETRQVMWALLFIGFRPRRGGKMLDRARIKRFINESLTYKEMTTMASVTERQAAFFWKALNDDRFLHDRGQKRQNVEKMVEEDRKAGVFYDPKGQPLFDVEAHYPTRAPGIL